MTTSPEGFLNFHLFSRLRVCFSSTRLRTSESTAVVASVGGEMGTVFLSEAGEGGDPDVWVWHVAAISKQKKIYI